MLWRAGDKPAEDYGSICVAGTSGRCAGHAILAQCLVMSGHYEEARAAAERSIALYDPEKHRTMVLTYGVDPRTFAHSMLAYALAFLGHLDRAVTEADRAIAWGRVLNLPTWWHEACFSRRSFTNCATIRREPSR